MEDTSEHEASGPSCSGALTAELESERLHLLQFTLGIEQACADMRRETAARIASPLRQAEIANYITERAVTLSGFVTGRLRLTDDMKKRILSTFSTLLLLRENLDRAANPSGEPALRTDTSETSLAPLINEQDETEKGKDEREYDEGAVLGGFGCRGAKRAAAQWSGSHSERLMGALRAARIRSGR